MVLTGGVGGPTPGRRWSTCAHPHTVAATAGPTTCHGVRDTRAAVHSPRHDARGHRTAGPGLRVLRLVRLARGHHTHRSCGGGGGGGSDHHFGHEKCFQGKDRGFSCCTDPGALQTQHCARRISSGVHTTECSAARPGNGVPTCRPGHCTLRPLLCNALCPSEQSLEYSPHTHA